MTQVVRRSRRRRLRAFFRLHLRRAALRRARRRKLLGPAACLLIALLCALAARYEPERNFAAGLAIDAAVALRTVVAPWDGMETRPEVVVVGMDRRTLNYPAYAEWPRVLMNGVWADAAETAFAAGARGAVFDVIFSFAAPRGNEDMRDAIADLDQPLTDLFAVHRREIVIARTARFAPAERFSGLFFSGGVALAEMPNDGDGVIRRAPAAFRTQSGGGFPTLSGDALKRIAKVTEETDPDEVVHLTPPFPIRALPSAAVVDIVNCGDEAALRRLFDGRIVLFGGAVNVEDQVKAADRFLTQPDPPADVPYEEACAFPALDAGLPGVFTHAAAIDGALRGWAPRAAEEAGGGVALWAAFATALAAGLLAFFAGAWPGAIAAFAVLPAFFLLVSAIMLDRGLVLAFAAPIFAAPAAYTASLGVKAWVFDGVKRLMQRQFSHYLSREVIDEMVERETLPRLGGETRTVTIMFVDLSGFTKFAEDPENSAAHVMQVLNRHLTVIAQAVHDYGGYVDKFIGDAVMAIWNAPRETNDHAALALGAAVQIRREIAATARPGRPAMKVKIGVESGDATVGNVGAPDRLSYTAVGDIVNLAARLEAANSRFRAGVLVGPNAAGAAESTEMASPPLLRIATITVKGRERTPTGISTPVGADDPAVVAGHETARAAFEAGDFAGAAALWRKLPGDAAPWAAAMAEEADALAAAPPADWSGVINLTEK